MQYTLYGFVSTTPLYDLMLKIFPFKKSSEFLHTVTVAYVQQKILWTHTFSSFQSGLMMMDVGESDSKFDRAEYFHARRLDKVCVLYDRMENGKD